MNVSGYAIEIMHIRQQSFNAICFNLYYWSSGIAVRYESLTTGAQF